MKCFVTFRLRPEVSHDAYEAWFREVNVPAIKKMKTVGRYDVWRILAAAEGEAPFQILEEMEITDRASFESELETVPEVVAMLEGWYERVVDPVIVYAGEVAQTT
jgi:hypothetical protein